MSKELEAVLQDIKKRPGVYLGKETLDGLMSFVYGYMHCMNIRDGNLPDDFVGFQEFVEKYYCLEKFCLNRFWADIIEFFSDSEEDAFYKFYELFYEFSKTEN